MSSLHSLDPTWWRKKKIKFSPALEPFSFTADITHMRRTEWKTTLITVPNATWLVQQIMLEEKLLKVINHLLSTADVQALPREA